MSEDIIFKSKRSFSRKVLTFLRKQFFSLIISHYFTHHAKPYFLQIVSLSIFVVVFFFLFRSTLPLTRNGRYYKFPAIK